MRASSSSDFRACVGKVQDAAFAPVGRADDPATTADKLKVWKMACAGFVGWLVVWLAGSLVGMLVRERLIQLIGSGLRTGK